MALHALDDIDDALAATREFLTPLDAGRWLRVALIAFFVGGTGMNAPTGGFNAAQTPAPDTLPHGPIAPPHLPSHTVAIVAGIVALVLLLALAFAVVGSVMEFVFVESLRSGDVRIRRYARARWRQGLRLFGFRVVVGLAGLALLLGGGLFVFGTGHLLASPVALVGALVVLLPGLLVLGVTAGVVNGFTTVFVVPIMILEDCGVLSAWRRLWPALVREWKQFLAYAVLGLILSVGGGLVVAIAVGIAAVLLLFPFGVLGLIVFLVLGIDSIAGIAVLGLLGLLAGLCLLAAVALAKVPVQTFLRFYALLVLGDIEPSLDAIPDPRAAVRAGSGSANG